MQFSTDMDSLELHLKLEKMDPSLVPDSCVKHMNELHQKMATDWSEVDGKGKQLAKDAAEVCLSTCHPPVPSHVEFTCLAACHGCCPKKRSGGRLKQDLDKDLQLQRILILPC